jgi:uncharacterized Zn finger protein (UPF0148 family)
VTAYCLKCDTKVLPVAESGACPSCGHDLKKEEQEKEQRRREDEQRRKKEAQHLQEEYQNTTQELKLHLKSEGDYIGLEVNLRRKSEKFFMTIASKAIDEWHPFEAELFRLLINFPKRKECLSLAEDNVGGNKHLLAELKKLNGLMETLVQGQGKQIGMSKDNQNAAKIGIAAHLLTGGTAGAVARGIEDAFDSDEE